MAGEQIIAYSIEVRGALQAFDQETGSRLWATPLESCSDGAGFADDLEIGDGKVFVSPSSGSCLFAVDLLDGRGSRPCHGSGSVDGVLSFEPGLQCGQILGPDGAISIGHRQASGKVPQRRRLHLRRTRASLWAVTDAFLFERGM